MKIRNKYILTILLLLILVTLSACGGGEKSNDVITDKSEISVALEPVRQALPRIYDITNGTLTGEYEGAFLAGTAVKEQLNFEKRAKGKYYFIYKETNKDGLEKEYVKDDGELIPLIYPTIKTLEDTLSNATKLTIREKDGGKEYRVDLNFESIGGVAVKDAYFIFFIDKSDMVTKYTFHFVNSQGEETLESSAKILLSDYNL